ncbi:MAG: DUF397 domain-containing protein [Pseudonocardiaceae bacterium]
MDDLTGAWCKSSYSANLEKCVEIAELAGGHRAVRDSKDPGGAALMFTAAGWSAFTAGMKSGEFD